PATAHDVAVGGLVLLARAVAERRHAPGGDRVTSRSRRSLAASVRVVDRVHRRPAGLRAHAHVALAPRLADLHVLVVGVADDADGRAALGADHPHLTRGQAQRRHVAVAGHQLRGGTRRTRHLTAPTGLQLDVVDDRADRHTSELEAVPDRDFRALARGDRHPDGQPLRREDVALLAVDVVQQGDVGGAVGVVLDRRDLRGHAVLATLEVDPPVGALGPPTAVARGLTAVGVAPAALLEPFDERLLRLGLGDLREVRIGDEPHPRTGRLWLANRHLLTLQPREALEHRNRLTGTDLHDRLLPLPRPAAGRAPPLGLGLDAERADLHDVDVEESLDGLADLRLVGVGVDAEGVAVGRGEHVALLRDHRADDHLRVLHQEASSPAVAPDAARGAPVRAVRASRAFSESSSEAAPTTSVTPTLSASITATRSMLRNESAASDSSAASTTSVGADWLHPSSRSKACLVFGAVNALVSRIASAPRPACRDSALRSAARCSLRLTLKV